MPGEPLDAQDAWNQGADAYCHFVESGADYYRHRVHGPALLAACGALAGARVLDVGCGQGYFSRLLARAGAVVVAVDLSERLLARAQEMETAQPLGIAYRHLDATQIGSQLDAASFDLVTGCMSLQDVADPGRLLAGAAHVLVDQGRAVFSIPHPCTDVPFRKWQRDAQGRKGALCLDRYFESGPAVCHWNMARLLYPWRTPYRRHTLSEWSTLIHQAGFTIRRLTEPRPDAAAVLAHPDLEDCARLPFFLIFELVKRPPQA